MIFFNSIHRVLFATLLLLSTSIVSADSLKSSKALVKLAAEYLNSTFMDIEKSTKTIGDYYLYMYKQDSIINAHDRMFWESKQVHQDKMTQFKLFNNDMRPSYFKYTNTDLSDANIKELNTLENLSWVIQTVYNSSDYSWIYVTTADNIFSIYPTLSPEEAVNNYLPTQQTFYTCADFKNKKVGWSKVYDDLVGDGMMITASYPIYDADTLLGVASRDVTLNELSTKVFSHLVINNEYAVFMVDGEDKVIASSDNTKASEYAVLKKMGTISSKIDTTGFSIVLLKTTQANH